MDTILQGTPQTSCFIDDILITGSSEEEHLKNLEMVLFCRLQAHGVQLKKKRFIHERVGGVFRPPGGHGCQWDKSNSRKNYSN